MAPICSRQSHLGEIPAYARQAQVSMRRGAATPIIPVKTDRRGAQMKSAGLRQIKNRHLEIPETGISLVHLSEHQVFQDQHSCRFSFHAQNL